MSAIISTTIRHRIYADVYLVSVTTFAFIALPLFVVTLSLKFNLLWVMIPWKVYPAVIPWLRVVPSVVMVIIVIPAIDVVGVYQFHRYWKWRCDSYTRAVGSHVFRA